MRRKNFFVILFKMLGLGDQGAVRGGCHASSGVRHGTRYGCHMSLGGRRKTIGGCHFTCGGCHLALGNRHRIVGNRSRAGRAAGWRRGNRSRPESSDRPSRSRFGKNSEQTGARARNTPFGSWRSANMFLFRESVDIDNRARGLPFHPPEENRDSPAFNREITGSLWGGDARRALKATS
uniref:Uncharacterized protein n=1 Tax=Candidatus Kentrum sp. MB TaxID=2138164 RepID=A0A451BH32_9GAMM|nr:MAG: hypothetical protein BECKMB1821G_GA0114241_11513 [Candidatus Kentron sp. MB]VFK35921.1 MAG: hypothetical protein BECKMB1821I_GA0114274_11633 [Candidatus Kentron sp. MB]VFK77566.1 MAG: hypothetical protein BECKMB1821H_GA0114242_11653 [Candidatus Kentron sp. MB]